MENVMNSMRGEFTEEEAKKCFTLWFFRNETRTRSSFTSSVLGGIGGVHKQTRVCRALPRLKGGARSRQSSPGMFGA